LPVVDFVLQRLEARYDLKTAQGKGAAAEEIAEVLAGIASPIEQDHYTNEVAMRLKVEPAAVRRLLRGKRQRTAAPVQPARQQPVEVRGDTDDDYLLALLLRLRELPDLVTAPTGEFEFMLSETRALHEALGGETPAGLEPYAERARRRLADVERLSTPDLLKDIEQTRLRIRKRRLERKIKEISSLGDDAEVRGLMSQLSQLAHAIGAIDQELSPERESAGSR
jgi:DNA primase